MIPRLKGLNMLTWIRCHLGYMASHYALCNWLHWNMPQVVTYRRLKILENSQLWAQKVVMVSYERWTPTRGFNYNDLIEIILVLGTSGHLQQVVARDVPLHDLQLSYQANWELFKLPVHIIPVGGQSINECELAWTVGETFLWLYRILFIWCREKWKSESPGSCSVHIFMFVEEVQCLRRNMKIIHIFHCICSTESRSASP